MQPSRREFLRVVAAACGGVPAGVSAKHLVVGGHFVGYVPLRRPKGYFQGAPPPLPLDTRLGSGPTARLLTDLSTLDERSLITPNERFFIRTGCARPITTNPLAGLHIGGLVERPQTFQWSDLADFSRPTGTHLMECSGNADAANFGLMSSAEWTGVPMSLLLEIARPRQGGTRVLVVGHDGPGELSARPQDGASWTFSLEELEEAKTFLATRMNDLPLSCDHGAPLRLVVPGWYGCACIKWVSRIDVVGEETEATPQMRAFAGRTHQDGTPRLARDYAPALIDHAAVPVRVERWVVDGRLICRVVGVMWGGTRPTNALWIQFGDQAPFRPVDECPLPATTATWTLWSHVWYPTAPGRYQIALEINDRSIRTRRLDRRFYVREIELADV